MTEGKRIIVIPHSQGNLFANTTIANAVGSDTERFGETIGLFGVATPANRIAEGGEYITASDDRIIDGLRLFRPVLPANLNNDPGLFGDERSWTNHYFDRDYFSPELESRNRIDAAVDQLARDLIYPVVEAGDKALEVRIASPSGLFVDVLEFTDNGGPNILGEIGGSGDIYTLDCSRAEQGVYVVSFVVTSPTSGTASIQLQLGDSEEPEEEALTGDYDFTKFDPDFFNVQQNAVSCPIANVFVEESEDERIWEYEIEALGDSYCVDPCNFGPLQAVCEDESGGTFGTGGGIQ